MRTLLSIAEAAWWLLVCLCWWWTLTAACSAGDFEGLARGILAIYSRPSPAPTPGPAPVPPTPGGVCDNCNGRGKVGDGAVMVECPVCDGTGKKKTTSAAPPAVKTAPASAAPPRAPRATAPAIPYGGDCANGQCSPPTQQQRPSWFRRR